MEAVEADAKKYEAISMHADPLYLKFKDSIDIVKQFIRSRRLVVYGGTAIDYALRLRGDNIYPDESLAVPDLDVYSSDIVKDSYDLADILFASGYSDVRVVVGRYVRVMKVDIADKHFVADIAYLSKSVFELLPSVEYEGMRVVHPNFQRVDLHSSLTYPFDGAPLEVIFNRWNKDITRFNKLHEAYPVDPSTPIDKSQLQWVGIERRLCVETFAGFAGYAVVRRALVAAVGESKLSGIIPGEIRDNKETISFQIPYRRVEFLHHTPEQFLAKYPVVYQKYASVGSMLPKHWLGESHGISILLYSGAHRYTCVASSEGGGLPRLKCVGVQWLLAYFIGGYLFTRLFLRGVNDVDIAVAKNTFLEYYKSTLKMVEIAETHYMNSVGGMSDEQINKSVFLPNTYVYGADNESENQIIQNKNTIAQREQSSADRPLPTNYYPARGKSHPKFDYDASIYYVKDGRPLGPPRVHTSIEYEKH